jgi:serine/threonine protein kinase
MILPPAPYNPLTPLPLMPGTRLGSYEILAPLGEGGMGAVYRARDTKLGRAVAIKVILDEFASNDERVGRFEREAKMLAALHHQRIASLFGLEHAEGRHFLVMELVEGETLAERLRRGAVPVEEALPIAIQIAEALEAAHEKGVVHRDLKPANVKITPDGEVKVLDFGLAKVMESEATSAAGANSPTLSMMATQAGLILGTAAYMSPEQAKGFPADHRSDIFSFGAVLFETLAGRRPFTGDTANDLLASVLVRDPDLDKLPGDLNPRLIELVKRCLQKNPKKRWQAIGDVRAELESLLAAPRAVAVPGFAAAPAKPFWKRALPSAVIAVLAAAIASGVTWQLKPDAPRPVSRFSIVLPRGQQFRPQFTSPGRQQLDISPDGERIVYVADNRLFVRPISEVTATIIPGFIAGTLVNSPTFSSDGRSVAYYSAGERSIKQIPVSGGAPITVGRADNPSGISWSGGDIFVGQGADGILRMSAHGGSVETVVKVTNDERAHGPHLLPDGENILFTLAPGNAANRWDLASIVVQSLRTGTRKVLIPRGSDARYLSTGHIVYTVAGTVFAIRFDPRKLEVHGSPVQILEGVRRAPATATAAAQFAVSENGMLAYIPGPATGTDRYDVILADRQGTNTSLKLPPGPYESPRVSGDGKRIAFGTEDANDAAVYIHDLGGSTVPRRITFTGRNRLPVWTSDSRRVVFQSDREGDRALFWQEVDGHGTAERLTRPEKGVEHIPDECSSTGQTLLFTELKGTTYSLWVFSLRERKAIPFGGVQSTVPGGARFSGDSRWVAYAIKDGPLATILVQPFPPTGARYQMPRKMDDDPHHPLWSPDGKALFYIPRPSGFESVPFGTEPPLGFGSSVAVPYNFRTGGPAERAHYDMMPDGRILGLTSAADDAGTSGLPEIRVVLNWFEELKGKLPK